MIYRGAWPWGLLRKLLSPWGVRTLLKPWISPRSALWPTENRSLHKTVKGSLWVDALQRKDSDAAIESSWRSEFVEQWPFLWSVGVPEVPEGFSVRPWGIPGACPGSNRHPRGLQGRPKVPRSLSTG